MFIAVGTPPDEDGSADLQYVLAVASAIGQHLRKPAVVVDKSTVPVGTADKVRATIAAELWRRAANHRVRRGVESGIPEGGRCGRGLHAPGPRRVGADNPHGGDAACACTRRSTATTIASS
jgi:UDPglucose 6-dehydrogenase